MSLDLQSLKISVDTKELDTAIKKLDDLQTKSKAIKTVAKELAQAAKQQAQADTAAAKASEAQAKAQTQQAKAAEAVAKAEEKAAKAKQATKKANQEVADSVDKLIKLYQDQVEKANLLEQGFSRGEASLLIRAKNLGALTSEVEDFIQVVERQRKAIGKDPFDGTGQSLKRLQRELDIANTMVDQFGTSGALTKKQWKELAQDLDMVTARGKQFGLSQKEIADEQARVRNEFMLTAAQVNNQNKRFKELEKTSKEMADSHVTAFQKMQRQNQAATESFERYYQKLIVTKNEQKELYNQGVFSRQTINQLAEIETRARAIGKSSDEIAKMKLEIMKLDQGNARLKFMHQLMGSLTSQVLSLGAAWASVNGIVGGAGAYITTSDNLANLEMRLKTVSQGTLNFNKTFDEMLRIANLAKVPVKDVTELFVRLVPVMPAMGKGAADAAKMTESLTLMLRLAGKSSSEASSAILQFSQAMAKGKLDGDEFRSVAENLPELLRLMEKDLGKTRAELMLMSSAGELTASIVGGSLTKALEDLRKEASQMPKTVEGAMAILRNNMTELVKKMEEATGASSTLATGIEKVAGGIKSLAEAGPGVVGVLTTLGTFATGAAVIGIGRWVVGLQGVATAIGGISAALKIFNPLSMHPAAKILLGVSALAGVSAAVGSANNSFKTVKEATDKLVDVDRKEQAIKKQIEGLKANKWDSKGQLLKAAETELAQLQDYKKTVTAYIDAQREQANLTREAQTNAKLSDQQKAATMGSNVEFRKGLGLNEAEDIQAKYMKNQEEANNRYTGSLIKLKDARDNAIEDLKKSGKSAQAVQASIAEVENNYKKSVANTVGDHQRIMDDLEKDFQEKLKKQNKKDSGPQRQASSEGYTVQSENILSTLKKSYEDQLQTLNAGEKSLIATTKQMREAGLISQDEYNLKQAEATKNFNTQELERTKQYAADYEAEVQRQIEAKKKMYASFVSNESGKQGFADLNKTMKAKLEADINDLTRSVAVVNAQVGELQARQIYETYGRISESVLGTAKSITSLTDEMDDLLLKEKQLADQRQADLDIQEKTRFMTESQAAAYKAEIEETTRLNKAKEKIDEQIASVTEEFNKQKAAIEGTTWATVDAIVAEMDLQIAMEKSEEKLAALIQKRDEYNNLLKVLPAQQAQKALDAQNSKLVDSIADAISTGIFEGGEAGGQKLRDVLEAQLKEPIQVFIKAVVSDMSGMISGKSSGFSNATGAMSNLSSLFSVFTNPSSIATSMGTGLASLGSALGSSAMSSFAAGMQGSTLAAGLAGPTTAGASGAMGLGASMGSFLSVAGPVAAALVAAKMIAGDYQLGGLGDASFLLPGAARLFGMKKKQITGSGITGTFGGDSFTGNSYQDWFQKGGWLRSNKSGTTLGALDQGTSDAFTKQFQAIRLAVGMASTSVGISAENITKFSKSIKLALTSDDAKNQEAIAAMFTDLSNSMVDYIVPAIAQYKRENEDSTAALTRLSTSLTGVNTVFKAMGRSLIDLSLGSADAASSLVDLFGSIDKLQDASSKYVDLFYTDAQKFALTLGQVQSVFSGLGITVPATKEQFKAMVDALDVTTEFGKNAYYALINIAPAFASLFESAETTKSKFTEVAKSIRDTISGIKTSQLTPVNEFAAMKQTFDTLVARASVAQGDELVSLSNQINSAIEPLISKAKDVYATGSEFVSLQEEIFAKAGLIANVSDSAGTVQDQSLNELQTMSSILAKIQESGTLTVDKLTALLALNTNYSGTPTGIGSAGTSNVAAIQKATEEAEKLIAGARAQQILPELASQISSLTNQIQLLTNEGNSLSMAGKYAERYRKTVEIPNMIASLQQQLQPLQSSFADYSSQSYGDFSQDSLEAQLTALRALVTAAGGTPMFAKGGAFTNGVVQHPTMFNMAVMGEEGSEAIMPLAKTADGSLGVKASGASMDTSGIERKLSEANQHAEANVRVNQAVGTRVLEKLEQIERRLEGLENTARLEVYNS